MCRTRALLKHRESEVSTPADNNKSRHSQRQSHRPVSSSCSAVSLAHCSYCRRPAARVPRVRPVCARAGRRAARRTRAASALRRRRPAPRKRIVRASRTAQASAFLAECSPALHRANALVSAAPTTKTKCRERLRIRAPRVEWRSANWTQNGAALRTEESERACGMSSARRPAGSLSDARLLTYYSSVKNQRVKKEYDE